MVKVIFLEVEVRGKLSGDYTGSGVNSLYPCIGFVQVLRLLRIVDVHLVHDYIGDYLAVVKEVVDYGDICCWQKRSLWKQLCQVSFESFFCQDILSECSEILLSFPWDTNLEAH